MTVVSVETLEELKQTWLRRITLLTRFIKGKPTGVKITQPRLGLKNPGGMVALKDLLQEKMLY